MSRKRADKEHFSLRRIPPTSSNWRENPPGATSGAYNDDAGEVSVDINVDNPLTCIEEIKKKFCRFILDKGAGYTYAQVGEINEALSKKDIDGEVLLDPLEDLPDHAVITGNNTKSKRKTLEKTFQNLIEPRKISEIKKL